MARVPVAPSQCSCDRYAGSCVCRARGKRSVDVGGVLAVVIPILSLVGLTRCPPQGIRLIQRGNR